MTSVHPELDTTAVNTILNEILEAESLDEQIANLRKSTMADVVRTYVPAGSLEEQWDVDGLKQAVDKDFAVTVEPKVWLEEDKNFVEEGLRKRVHEIIDTAYESKVELYGAPVVRHVEKAIMLQQLDSHWREHLAAMDYLRQGIHLRSYAQKNPKQEYKREAFELFTAMLDRIKHDTVSLLSRMQLKTQEEIDAEEAERQQRLERAMQFQHAAPEQLAPPPQAFPEAFGQGQEEVDPQVAQFVRDSKKVGRNEPCPCGSGKKYKHCHGALAKEG